MEYFLMVAIPLIAMMINDAIQSDRDSKARQEAREADARALQNQKEFLDYQIQKQQETNTIATQKGHAADAGYNPALLYGSMSSPSLLDVSGSSGQGTPADLSHVFNKIPQPDVSGMLMQKMQQNILARQVSSQEDVNHSVKMLNLARTAEQLRNTKFQKSMERVIYDRGMAELDMMRSQKQGIDIANNRASLMLPLELEQQGLLNQQTAENIKLTTEKIETNKVERAKLRADMSYINSQIERNNHLNILTDAQFAETKERFKGSVVERVLSEYGLVNRKLPGFLSHFEKANWLIKDPRFVGAVAQLCNLGFSQEEAVQTVIYYQASNAKDASPSLINAVSRGISALILKK